MAVSEEMIKLDEWRVERLKCSLNKGTGKCEGTWTVKFKCTPLYCPRVDKEVKEALRCGDCIIFKTCDKRVLTGNADKICQDFDI